MPPTRRIPFKIPSRALAAHDISALHGALKKLGHGVPASEVKSGALGEATKTAIRDLQTRTGLPVDGRVTANTVATIDRELAHVFFAKSKTRTAELHEMLARLGQQIDPAERNTRVFGASTKLALKAFQKSAGLAEDGRMTDAVFDRLEASALAKRLSSKTQASTVQRKLIHVGKIAKLDVQIAKDELKGRTLGPTTKEFVRKFQAKYGLPQTGEIDPRTYERIESVAASRARPIQKLVVRPSETVTAVRHGLRINKEGPAVGQLQRSLAVLGFKIDQAEHAAANFGKTTRTAVIAFQKQKHLAPSGEVDATTKKAINAALVSTNPATVQPGAGTYRVRGSVRDERWAGKGQVRIEVWEAALRGNGTKLAERVTAANGFFDVPYSPPLNPVDQQPKRGFRLEIRRFDAANQEILPRQTIFNPTQIAWANTTSGNLTYRGLSEFTERMTRVSKILGGVAIATVVEDPNRPEVSHLAESAELTRDDVMRLILAHRTASSLGDATVDASALYAFIRQNIPTTLPSDLIAATENWTKIGDLTAKALQGVVLLEKSAQVVAFDAAVSENLIPVETALRRDAILAALDSQRARFALETPTLGESGTLKELLLQSSIPAQQHTEVAKAYVAAGGMGAAFWSDLQNRAAVFGGADKVADFEAATQVGEIAAQHRPTLTFLKAALADPARPNLNKPSDLAKLDDAGWSGLVQGIGVLPPDIVGNTPAERQKAYAAKLAAETERLFPAIALTEKVKPSAPQLGLDKIGEVQTFFESRLDVDFARVNVDKLIKDANPPNADAVRQQAKVVQRVHRIAPNTTVGAILLEAKIHHSTQVMRLGKTRFARLLEGKGIERAVALQTFARAEQRYAEMLTRFADFRATLHQGDPCAIVAYTYTEQERATYAGEIPNLETLFGPMDFCDCGECQSVYSPAAYVADVFRFLDSHETEKRDKTVLAHLFERRPDLGDLKLDCDNTKTPLPYIDLVCEILEAAVSPPNPAPVVHSFQTTRTASELRAFPENINSAAYEKLRKADFPFDVAFDLWQEETRVWLNHLGVPRHELMQAFQARPADGANAPKDVSIAGESFAISSYETALVTKVKATKARQDVFWGFDTSRTKVGVSEFLDHSKLEYPQLLDLIEVTWINTPAAPGKLAITPKSVCNVAVQSLENLTLARFDRIHRFLRLWRHSSWKMWELDLLIRAAHLGGGKIDDNALVNFQRFRDLQFRLGLPLEVALAFYAPLNREPRVRADDRSKKDVPLYTRLFEDPAVSSPLDPAFAGPTATEALTDHKRVLLAALAVGDSDLQRLIARTHHGPPVATDGKLTLDNLTQLHSEATLARALKMRIEDWITFVELSGMGDVFQTPKKTLEFLEAYDDFVASGLSVTELDYVLQHRPDSPHGLREEALTTVLEGIRESLRAAFAADPVAKPGSLLEPRDADDAYFSGLSAQAVAVARQAFATRVEVTREGVAVERIASFLSLAPDLARVLLEKLHNDVPETLLTILTAKTLAGPTKITVANFPDAYAALRKLHKAALIVAKAGIGRTDDLAWAVTASGKIGSLDFSQLPVAAAPPASLFGAWRSFARWARLRASIPEPEGTSWRGVFDLAVDKNGANPATPLANLHDAISRLSGGRWIAADLKAAHDALKIRYDATGIDYTSVETWERLMKAVGVAKRVGVDAARVAKWALRDEDLPQGARLKAAKAVSQETREAAKAKYDYAAWLATAVPLSDPLREKKRAALARYLVETSLRTEKREVTIDGKKWRNPKRWENSDDLFRYFLIDVEMCACQGTSRIKQAISSTQTFVQRCFLNLERPQVQVSQAERDDEVTLDSWRQWRWMKNYRVWEAARKVFLYPENWILPELRDNKSPIFKELEDELLQSDLTDANAETAFVHYLQKLHEVARTEVVGLYHEIDDPDPRDDAPPRDRLHVISRTKSDPAVYYHRYLDYRDDEWTPWTKIEVDISGEHVQPVVYNRKLFLFWLVFLEKPQKTHKQPAAKPSNGPTTSPESAKQIEIQLAWTDQKNGGWTPKKLSREKFIHPWERPLHSYHLRPRYKPDTNLLWLDVYISTSAEFNNTKFYDAFTGERDYLTSHRFDETGRPWHSSSFVFDGDVVALKMKGLAGNYRLIDAAGAPSETLSLTSSYVYVSRGFGAVGRAIEKLEGGYQIGPRLPLPEGMHYRWNRLVNNRESLNPNRLNVLERATSRRLLNGAKGPFEIVYSPNRIAFDTASYGAESFVYQDRDRAFFVRTEDRSVRVGRNSIVLRSGYRFFPFYHPYSGLLLREINRSGVDGLLSRRLQRLPESYLPNTGFAFASYQPVAPVEADATVSRDVMDFDRRGAYASYNWEVFFHAPFLIACKLSQNQRFEEAMRWFHRIFDPTNTEALGTPQRFWITKPFYEQNSDDYRKQRIEILVRAIDDNLDQVAAWRNDPFNPHRIARHRPIAYQKAVVMKYLDNLIAWGDQLFRRDTIESINEATLLYTLAHEILGPKPIQVPRIDHQFKSYNELVQGGGLDAFGNAAAEIETLTVPGSTTTVSDPNAEPLPYIDTLYFCIPPNDKLLGYWSTVEDRLYKIRHCQNIEGVFRQLPLFEPPIDPVLLVKAAAAGVDLGSVLSELDVDPGQYRYRVLVAKAAEFCGEVRALGEKLLSVLEKRDAEALSTLRATHEVKLLEASREVRKKQVAEAVEAIAALEQSKALAEGRRDYYRGRDHMNPWEITALALSGGSALAQAAIAAGYILAGGLRFIPRFVAGGSGFGGSPVAAVDVVDGKQISDSAEYGVKTLGAIATSLDKFAAMSSTLGAYQRRKDDWDFQASQADIEIKQIDKQSAGAEIRQAIAEREQQNLELQIEQSQAAEEYLRTKYTNRELYDWMLGQVATVYFQAYKLAFDMARKAEKCLQFELGRADASFIQFGYWDSLKKGLLSGERLANDIHRMESSYLALNERELELTKDISIAEIDPLALVTLKTTGECTITLPEWLYDMDYQGHYRRRIRSVSVTVPCVAGPYTGVHATLSLVQHGVRVKDDVPGGAYGDPLAPNDDRFASGNVPVAAIATSHASNDAGLFELSFNDDRYLPFEGAGAVSKWRLSMPQATNYFDFDTITDVVLHVRYTARAGRKALGDAAKVNLAAKLPTSGVVLFDLMRAFGSEWQRFFSPAANTDEVLAFTLGPDHLPFYARGKTARVRGVDLVLLSGHNGNFDVTFRAAGSSAVVAVAAQDPALAGAQHMPVTFPWQPPQPPGAPLVPPPLFVGDWTVQIKKHNAGDYRTLVRADVTAAFLMIGFSI
jgi:peptidoglycan hydrolase-like protein with peptidoglycan-binding domain